MVTYKGWPLYLFAGDTKKPGQAIGQDLNVTGGYWYVISYYRCADQAQADQGRHRHRHHNHGDDDRGDNHRDADVPT